MNKLRITLLLFVFIAGLFVSAKDDEQLSTDEELGIAYLQLKRPKQRPQMPTKIFMECHYRHGYIKFLFPSTSEANLINITLDRNESIVWIGSVTRENPEVAIPVLFGEYDITCRTDGNQIFKGKLNFE